MLLLHKRLYVQWLAHPQYRVDVACDWYQKYGYDSSHHMYKYYVYPIHVEGPTMKALVSEIWVLLLFFVLSTGYDKVLCNNYDIITALRSIPDAKDKLTGKYKQGQWIDITGTPTEDQMVNLALQRIKQDPKQYDIFIDMLRDIPGMDITVKRITSC